MEKEINYLPAYSDLSSKIGKKYHITGKEEKKRNAS